MTAPATSRRSRFSRPFGQDRLDALLRVADTLERVLEFDGDTVTESAFFRALFLARHSTALSIDQLLDLEWRAIQPTGHIPLEFRLSREAMLAIARIASPGRPQVFAVPEGFDVMERCRLIAKFASFEQRNGGAA